MIPKILAIDNIQIIGRADRETDTGGHYTIHMETPRQFPEQRHTTPSWQRMCCNCRHWHRDGMKTRAITICRKSLANTWRDDTCAQWENKYTDAGDGFPVVTRCTNQ